MLRPQRPAGATLPSPPGIEEYNRQMHGGRRASLHNTEIFLATLMPGLVVASYEFTI